MRRAFSLLWAAGLLAGSLSAAELPLTVEDSGSREIETLVRQLISERPAPYPTGYSDLPNEAVVAAPYRTARVTAAMLQLKALGTRIFPVLVKHLGDDRYSFSDVSAAWINHSVGDAVVEVLSDGHLTHSGYKFRRSPSGQVIYLSFHDYLQAREPERWAEWARSRRQLEIQNDFIDWSLEQERARGFADEPQRRKVLEFYQQARAEVQRLYANRPVNPAPATPAPTPALAPAGEPAAKTPPASVPLPAPSDRPGKP